MVSEPSEGSAVQFAPPFTVRYNSPPLPPAQPCRESLKVTAHRVWFPRFCCTQTMESWGEATAAPQRKIHGATERRIRARRDIKDDYSVFGVFGMVKSPP